MPGQQCEAVQRWLRQDETAALATPPPAELATHVAGCSACRGLLVVTTAALLRAPAPLADLSCDTCQGLIDAYIDCERRRGVAAALRRYPRAWWHLWTCVDCAEVYQFTHALLDAEDKHTLMPIPIAPAARQPALAARLPALRLPRAFLHGVFAPHAALGTAWGGGDDETLFAEEQLAGYHIAISVRQRGATHCGIGIAVTPPLAGWAVIGFGEQRFRAPFDRRGQAVIAAIPFALLTDRDGPDMLMTIEPNDDAD